MQVQQLIERARRAAPGALHAGQQTKRALGKELICGTCGIEEKQKPTKSD
jgi:hypothetical protein